MSYRYRRKLPRKSATDPRTPCQAFREFVQPVPRLAVRVVEGLGVKPEKGAIPMRTTRTRTSKSRSMSSPTIRRSLRRGSSQPRLLKIAFPCHASAQAADTPLVSHGSPRLRATDARASWCRGVMEVDVGARATTGLVLHHDYRISVATVSSGSALRCTRNSRGSRKLLTSQHQDSTESVTHHSR